MCYDCTVKCHNLPSQLSSFIGREREIATANRLLHQTRLLTLTGPGGCGKTRLAIAVAVRLTRRYPDGVWFVDLASVSDPDLVPQAVAAALDFRTLPGRPVLEALTGQLRTRRVLFLLDNCEHLLRACTDLAYTLLMACPNIRILATSRESLHVTGETTWTVPPLAAPEPKALPRLEELGRMEAVRLFVERAGHISPGFALNEQNALAVSQICSWLAGSPLAIELAAARTRVLSPEQIATRLDDALSFLATADRTVPLRHRTLQATLDWSYDLLPVGEQSLFRRLAVFAAGFSVEAAEALGAEVECSVAGGDATTPVLDLLGGLVDKSLLEIEAEAGLGQRFRYLEPVRQYALSKLRRAGEEPAARRCLVGWAVGIAERLGPDAYTAAAKQSSEQLEIEHANLRAALGWAVSDSRSAAEGHRLATALGQFWHNRGYLGEGLAWFEQLVKSLQEVPVQLQIDTLRGVAFLAIHARDFARARSCLERAVRISEELADRYRLPVLHHLLCFLTFAEGDLAEAERLCALTMQMFEDSGDDWGRAIVLFYQANIDYLQQDYLGAREAGQRSVEICRRIGAVPALARRLVRLGQTYQALGDLAEARACLAAGLRTSREAGDNWAIAMSVAALGSLARSQGQHERGAWLLGLTEHLLNTFGVPFWAVDELEYDRTRSDLLSLLGQRAFSEANERGRKDAAADLEAVLRRVLDEPAHGERRGAMPLPQAMDRPAPTASFPLSRREREVAALIAQGRSNAEIAAALFVGLRTVEAHVTHILNKLGFNSRAQIAAWIAAQTPAFPEPSHPRR